MKRPILAVFDMDGVLVDSEDTFKRACADALHKWGVYPNYDEFTPYTGMGDEIYIGGVSSSHGVPYVREMTDESYRLYGEYAKESLKVFDWSRPVPEALHDAGIKICVASSAGLFKVRTNLACIGIDEQIFTAIVSGDEVKNKKPHPDIFLRAAAKCGAEPCDCLVFEDAVSGVQAAKAAGMTACAVTTSFSRQELTDAGADFVCSDLREALEHFFDIKQM